MSEKRPLTKITCGGCDNTWTGLSFCHCSAAPVSSPCHRTFSSLTMFDRHRVGGRCADPADWGSDARLVDGVWRGPEWDAATFKRSA